MMANALAPACTTDRTSLDDIRQGIASDEREYSKIWPTGPMLIDAFDLLDLNDMATIETINCVLELSVQKGMNCFAILNVEDLLQTEGIYAMIDRFNILKRTLQRACDHLGLGTPQLQLERTATGLDLHVRLRLEPVCRGNVVSLETERRRRYLALAC